MTSQHNQSKRWRPRFSVRTLVIAVTLVCCYAACWEPTKKWGVSDVASVYYWDWHFNIDWDTPNLPADPIAEIFREWNLASSPLPFVVSNNNYVFALPNKPRQTVREYYFWFFGYVAKVPYERKLRPPIQLSGAHESADA